MPLTGSLTTAKAPGYLQKLFIYLAHKVEVGFTHGAGQTLFGFGRADLTATDSAHPVTLTLPEGADFTCHKHMIDKHLAIFTLREGGVGLTWEE